MRGFVFSFPGIRDGRVVQWSHMLGVVPAARASGLGVQLKLAQRTRAIEMGIDLIEWTFDPLQAFNAHMNFARLGTVAEHYEEDFYGASSSPLHAGTPTDRLMAEWHVTAPHVQRRIWSAGMPIVRDISVTAAPIVNPSVVTDGWLRPGKANLTLNAPRVLVEIPARFSELQAADPELAREWRQATREIFRSYLSEGRRVVDFLMARDGRCGHYLVAKRDATAIF
jgi:predicted GNAT superfamily acetyltransferase